jgi:hypothetical protein
MPGSTSRVRPMMARRFRFELLLEVGVGEILELAQLTLHPWRHAGVVDEQVDLAEDRSHGLHDRLPHLRLRDVARCGADLQALGLPACAQWPLHALQSSR